MPSVSSTFEVVTRKMLGNHYRCDYPSPDGTVVGAKVGVALGGSVGMGGGSPVGFGVWVGTRVGILVGCKKVVVKVGTASSSKWGTYSCCPM